MLSARIAYCGIYCSPYCRPHLGESLVAYTCAPVGSFLAATHHKKLSAMADSSKWTKQELRASKCGPCARCGGNAGDVPMTREQALEQMPSLCASWALVSQPGDNAEEQILKIERSFVTKNFVTAMDFLNKAAVIAEEEGHHPDFHLTNYRDIKVVVYTHTILGLHKNDFVLAAKLDAVPIVYSPKFLKDFPLTSAGIVEP
mmetsp:Transcript_3402/g.5459  ORF Transcript_3402/g.5459 Transcript_3402/m.5459 type:complete len:201 (-) Transcript_3402:136-738(-)